MSNQTGYIVKTLEKRGRELEGFMDGLNFAAFMVDESFSVCRLNAAALDLAGEEKYQHALGKKCYALFFKKESPCDYCMRKQKDSSLRELYQTYFRESQVMKTKMETPPLAKSLYIAQQQYVIESPEHEYLLIETLQDITFEKEIEEENARNQQLASMGRVIQTVAHEIQNPLTGLNFMVQNLKQKFKQNSEILEKLKLMQQDVSRATNIVNDLRSALEKSSYRLEPVDFKEVLETAVEIFERTNDRKLNQKLVLESNTDCLIQGNRDKLIQVLLNLFENSLESFLAAQPEEELTFWFFLREVFTRSAKVQTEQRFLEFEIIDNAGGISQENLKRIFDPYFTTKKNRSRNSGMGLAIVHKILDEHLGNIEVESMAHYTRFVIRILKQDTVNQ